MEAKGLLVKPSGLSMAERECIVKAHKTLAIDIGSA